MPVIGHTDSITHFTLLHREALKRKELRLAANIIAGHLLLTLLGNTAPSLSTLLLTILIKTMFFQYFKY